MRPVVIVVTFEGRQDLAEVGRVPYESAVQELAAASPIHRSRIEFIRGIMSAPESQVKPDSRVFEHYSHLLRSAFQVTA